jgi:hypothetical protein
MKDFKNYIETSSMIQKDFSNLPIQDRLAQGRDVGEKFIIEKLKEHGIEITPAKETKTDIKFKIDGYLGGNIREPVQIKLRRSFKPGRNDIAYEVLRNHDSAKTLSDQLNNYHQQGRDFRGTKVEHYFVLNQIETEIYYVPAFRLKNAVLESIREMNLSYFGGRLTKPFKAANGIDLRPTRDPDPNSFTPNKVMAFIPVESVVEESFSINKVQK